MPWALFNILVFPGFLFLSAYGLLVEYFDRKLYARMQNRVGPPWYQPLADFIKLISKETIIPEEADKNIFKLLPVFALAAASTAFLYIPIWGTQSLFPFAGDLIVVLYLLTIPTLTFFLAGWHSTSLYSTIGSVRALTQLFAYEVPLFMALLGPALLADTWSVSGIAEFYRLHPWYSLINIPGFAVGIVATQGKLERIPFDMPEAETEIVAGTFTEYSGKLLAIFRMTVDVELIVVSALLAAVYIPFFAVQSPILGFLLFVVKTLVIVFLLCVFRTVMARLRIEQMVNFCWKYVTPVALVQILIDLLLKGVLPV
jgi:NADH-quinone oxidoreductase subunit H